MRPIQTYGTTARLGQTRLGLDPKAGADSRPAHPRNANAKPAPRFTDWALI